MWTYEKWASGKAICWGEWTGTPRGVATIAGMYGWTITISLPPSLFISTDYVPTYSVHASAGIDLSGGVLNKTTSDFIGMGASQYGVSASTNITADIQIIGKWK